MFTNFPSADYTYMRFTSSLDLQHAVVQPAGPALAESFIVKST